MNCSEMFNIFEMCGGKLVCNYENKICTVKNTNLKCTIQSKADSEELDWLLWKHQDKKYVSGIIANKTVNKVHRYQNPKHSSIIINTLKEN
jgi:hypothetical protein